MSEVDFRKETDNDVYILENEIKNFEHKIKQNEEYSRYAYMSFYSAYTAYGLQRIYDGLLMRISLDNRPVTILQTQPPKKCDSLFHPPISTLDGKEPFEQQEGGVYIDKEGKEHTLSDLYYWHSYNKKIITDENGEEKEVSLKSGEPLSILGKDRCFGYWYKTRPLEAMNSAVNDFPYDIKSAIISSPLTDEQKQDLLNKLYVQESPVLQADHENLPWVKHFYKRCSGYKYTEPFKDEQEMLNEYNFITNMLKSKDLPKIVLDNLLLNLEYGKYYFYEEERL